MAIKSSLLCILVAWSMVLQGTLAETTQVAAAHAAAAAGIAAGVTSAAPSRALLTLNPGKRLVRAQIRLDTRVKQAQGTEVSARNAAVASVTKLLQGQEAGMKAIDAGVDAAADRAARLRAQAAAAPNRVTIRRADRAELAVERAVKGAEVAKDVLQAKTQKKIAGVIAWQAKAEDRAATRVEVAAAKVDRAQNRFNAWIARRGGGPGPAQPLPTPLNAAPPGAVRGGPQAALGLPGVGPAAVGPAAGVADAASSSDAAPLDLPFPK